MLLHSHHDPWGGDHQLFNDPGFNPGTDVPPLTEAVNSGEVLLVFTRQMSVEQLKKGPGLLCVRRSKQPYMGARDAIAAPRPGPVLHWSQPRSRFSQKSGVHDDMDMHRCADCGRPDTDACKYVVHAFLRFNTLDPRGEGGGLPHSASATATEAADAGQVLWVAWILRYRVPNTLEKVPAELHMAMWVAPVIGSGRRTSASAIRRARITLLSSSCEWQSRRCTPTRPCHRRLHTRRKSRSSSTRTSSSSKLRRPGWPHVSTDRPRPPLQLLVTPPTLPLAGPEDAGAPAAQEPFARTAGSGPPAGNQRWTATPPPP